LNLYNIACVMSLNSACVQIKLNEIVLDILTLNSTNLKSS